MFSGRPLKFHVITVFYKNGTNSLKKNAFFIMISLNKNPNDAVLHISRFLGNLVRKMNFVISQNCENVKKFDAHVTEAR